MAGMWGEREGEGEEDSAMPVGFALSHRTSGHMEPGARGRGRSRRRVSASLFTLKPGCASPYVYTPAVLLVSIACLTTSGHLEMCFSQNLQVQHPIG